VVADGQGIARKRVERLMRQAGIGGLRPRSAGGRPSTCRGCGCTSASLTARSSRRPRRDRGADRRRSPATAVPPFPGA